MAIRNKHPATFKWASNAGDNYLTTLQLETHPWTNFPTNRKSQCANLKSGHTARFKEKEPRAW